MHFGGEPTENKEDNYKRVETYYFLLSETFKCKL